MANEAAKAKRLSARFLLGNAGGLVPTVQTDDVDVAQSWLEHAAKMGLEGVVAEKRGDPYQAGKRSWIKVQAFETADLVVGGFTGGPASCAETVKAAASICRYCGFGPSGLNAPN
jgi:ATP-dependent DNA ligase